MRVCIAAVCVFLIVSAHCTSVSQETSPLQAQLVNSVFEAPAPIEVSESPKQGLEDFSLEECKEILYRYQDYLNIIDALEKKGKKVLKDLYEEMDRLGEKVAECGELIQL